MSVSSTERLDELDALLPARPAGRNIIGFAIEAIKELRKDVVHWREARRSCIEAGDMMKEEIERLHADLLTARGEAEDMSGEIAALREDRSELSERITDLLMPEIERLRGLLGDVQIILDSHNNIVGNLNGEIERLRKELAEKDDYIRTISRPIGAHSYE